jgi:DNA polymerase III subunit alpha
MQDNGFNPASISALWGVLVPFSDYAFNKAHTAAYGLVSYWTAYLKANYPTEYMAALLTSVKDDKDKMAIYLGECRRMGIKVLPPDVNESEMNFTPVGTDIRFGLSAVRNVGANVVALMSREREVQGKATSFHDFLDKAPLQACNKRLIESLIKAGAFDSLNHPRRALMEIFETAVDQVIDIKRNEANGQDDLFGAFGAFGGGSDSAPTMEQQVPEIPDWDKATKLAFEREMLGLYVSDHPLQGLEHVLAAEREISIGDLVAEDGPRDVSIAIAGMITSIVRKTTKSGDYMAILSVEDLEAGLEVVLFPKEYALVSTVLATDTVVRIRGRVRAREDSVTMQAQEVTIPDVDRGPGRPVVISLPATRCTAPVVAELRQVLRSHPGMTEVQLRLRANDKTSLWRIDQRLRVTPSPPLMADLKALLGPSCLSV